MMCSTQGCSEQAKYRYHPDPDEPAVIHLACLRCMEILRDMGLEDERMWSLSNKSVRVVLGVQEEPDA